jgi:hypothetical protein
MADISGLSGLQPVESIKLNEYKTQSTGFQMPEAGRYTLQAPESFPATAFTSSKSSGALLADISPTIVGPTSAGTQVRRQRVSAKVYDRDGGKASQVGDYLRAVGYTGDIPGDPQQIANLVEQTAGATFEAYIDWEATHFASGFKVKGMRNFPTNEVTGKRQSWVNHPTETVTNPETGKVEPLRLRANLVISKFIPKTN